MHGLRRRITALLLCATLGACALVSTGCGATSHAVGGIVAHHVANHVIGRRNAGKVFCLYNGHRFFVDVRHHNHLAAAINLYEALKSCHEGFGHRTR